MNERAAKSRNRLEQFTQNPRRALWTLSVPIMVGMSIQTLYTVVDMMFVGRVGADALTALAFNMPLLFFAMGTTFGLGTGVTALVARAAGAHDEQQATGIAQHSLAISLVLIVSFVVPGTIYGPRLLTLLGVPTELLPDAWSYFRIMVLGFPFMVFAVFLRSTLSGEGVVKVPVMIQGTATILNLILDPIFIFTLDMGVAGAALATVVAQACACLALIYVLFGRPETFVQLRFARFSFEPAIVRRIFAIGLPASLSFIVMSVGGGAFNRLLVERTGDAVAAHQVGMRIDQLVVLPIVALASSLVTLVGMFHGARRSDLLVGIVRYAIARGLLLAVTLGTVLYATAPWVVGVFTRSPSIRELGVLYVHIVVFGYPGMVISMLTGRVLQGLGRGTPMLVLTLMRVLLIAVPLAWLFTIVFERPVHWVWIAMVVGSVCTATLAGTWLLRVLATVHAPGTGPDSVSEAVEAT